MVVAGWALGMGSARYIESLLYQVKAADRTCWLYRLWLFSA
jgi:hypothetical protein